MNTENNQPPLYSSTRETAAIAFQATIFFIVSIAAIGAIMMTLTSSPTAKGASFLWLPAALQLLAGIWLGPWRGSIAGGLGAYLAGILAYGGWGPVDIIMNLVAGGLANSFLPSLLFKVLRIDPTLGAKSEADAHGVLRAAGRMILLTFVLLIITFSIRGLGLGAWGYLPLLLLLLILPFVLRGMNLKKRDAILALFVCVFISALSAVIGSYGQVVGGQPWQAALLGTGIGWFMGDTVSAVLGLYALAAFTSRAKETGIASC